APHRRSLRAIHFNDDPGVQCGPRSTPYPARRNNSKPATTLITMGASTAQKAEKPYTRLAGPSRSWLVLKTIPVTTPAKILNPVVDSRNGPKIKDTAIITRDRVVRGCRVLFQNASQCRPAAWPCRSRYLA